MNDNMSLRKIAKQYDYNYSYLCKSFYGFGLEEATAAQKTIYNGTKKCRTCQNTKELSKFHKSSERPDGYNRDCVDCATVLGKKHRERYKKINKPLLLDKTGEKFCKKCNILKKSDEFHCSLSRSDGLDTYCKLCASELEKIKYKKKVEENKDKIPTVTKECKKCNIIKIADELYISKSKKQNNKNEF